jgi:phage tail-like protein
MTMLPDIVGMSHKFVVTVGLFVLGSWSKVSGLAVKWDLAEYRVGNSDEYFKFAGVPKFERLKLSRAAALSSSTMVQQWLETSAQSGGAPMEGQVVLTAMGTPVAQWTLRAMFPIAWSISEFDASSSKVAMETLEIAYSGFLSTGNKYGG